MNLGSATLPSRAARLRSDPMSETLHCSVVTPVETLFEGEARYVNLPAWDGQLGVMPETSPFLTRLGTGVLTMELGSETRVFAVDGGFAQKDGRSLTLLADGAVGRESIDAAKAEAELAAAMAGSIEGAASVKERERLDRARKMAFTKVALARR